MELLIAGAVVLLLLFWVVAMYNGLITKRNRVREAFSQIDVQLKRRSSLIPNLIETVKGYVKHEKEVLTEVTKARTALMNAHTPGAQAAANSQLTGALNGLFAVAENYPQLKANENFLKLQTRITELEERIADRREFFNDDVNTYNTRIGQIPDVFVASFMDLKRREMFKVSEQDRRQVEVNFHDHGAARA